MDISLTDAEKKLADFMGDLSEEACCAGWMMNLEYTLWDAVLNGERSYGMHFITQEEIDRLIKLSDDCGSWIYFDDDNEETAIGIKEWEKKVQNSVDDDHDKVEK